MMAPNTSSPNGVLSVLKSLRRFLGFGDVEEPIVC